MGKETVQFKCHHCNHCCTEVVCLLTPWDVRRIARQTGAGPEDFVEFLGPEEIDEVPKSDPTWLRCNGRRYLMALRRDTGGCHFLDKQTRFCTIYAARPILCRLYPFKLHLTRERELKGFSLHKDVGCPRHRDGAVPTGPLYALYLDDDKHQDEYWDLVEEFNADDNPQKAPQDFIKLALRGL